jgi:hypothetical protein
MFARLRWSQACGIWNASMLAQMARLPHVMALMIRSQTCRCCEGDLINELAAMMRRTTHNLPVTVLLSMRSVRLTAESASCVGVRLYPSTPLLVFRCFRLAGCFMGFFLGFLVFIWFCGNSLSRAQKRGIIMGIMCNILLTLMRQTPVDSETSG